MYKVKFLLVIFSAMFFLGAVQVPKKAEDSEDWLNKEVDRLRKKVDTILYSKNVTKEDELAYFEEFPDSFEVFNVIFANSSKKNWGAPDSWEYNLNDPRIICNKKYKDLSDGYHYVIDCIDAFLNLKSIDKSKFYNKIINIASRGKWNADYINHFQYFFWKIVLNDVETFCKLLSSRSDAEVWGFWFFYFDTPHLPKTIIFANLDKIKEKVKAINLRIYNFMEGALQEARKGACTGH